MGNKTPSERADGRFFETVYYNQTVVFIFNELFCVWTVLRIEYRSLLSNEIVHCYRTDCKEKADALKNRNQTNP